MLLPLGSQAPFESRVILDGSQTSGHKKFSLGLFESRVILDGSQTSKRGEISKWLFESRVILDGSQTVRQCSQTQASV